MTETIGKPAGQSSGETSAALVWEHANHPVSRRFGDGYFSRDDGRAETRAVFLAGNGLPDRWQQGGAFTIAELGFGTGLNFFETVRAWMAAPRGGAQLTYVSFEQFPLGAADMLRALTPWPEMCGLAERCTANWPPAKGWQSFDIQGVRLQLAIGDANELLATWDGHADAWYLDGFAPSKNPELWNGTLMRQVFEKTVPGGTFSTYTAAGHVRRTLQDAGFDVERAPGFGGKRHRLQGCRPKNCRSG